MFNPKTNKEIPHICFTCRHRHGSAHPCPENGWKLEHCPVWQIGMCYTCVIPIGSTICQAEDMSGFPCPNYKL